jgi:hypothetical protein
MTSLQKLRQLSGPHCALLAVQYATASNITALRVLAALRPADLPLELTLSILLTYLPEDSEPPTHVELLHELATGSRDAGPDAAIALDVSTVEGLSPALAKKRRKALELLPVAHPLYAAEDGLDVFSHFLIHRAHRIDAQAGLLELVPQLVVPFLAHSEFLRTWFISTALPLLRLSYKYYPQSPTGSLDDFAQLAGKRAIDYQLAHVRHASGQDIHHVARDIKGVVAPWMCGASERKRRRLTSGGRRGSIAPEQPREPDDWECLFHWIAHTSKESLPLAAAAISEWDGPEDMDLGGFEEGRDYVHDEEQSQLEMRYAQTALACVYLIEKSDVGTLQTAHVMLKRICDLLNYDPPPELSVGVESLPSYNLPTPLLQGSSTSLLREEQLLQPDNILTKPSEGSVQVLKLVVFSACVFTTLDYDISIREVAQLTVRDDQSEQFSLLQKILHALSSSRREVDQWKTIRLKLLWLWNWGMESRDKDRHAQGVFDKLKRKTIETEILKALVETTLYPLVVQTYINTDPGQQPLSLPDVERIILASAMLHYDNASNGNRTRGGMKRAADIISAFAPHFRQSSRFQRAQSLLSATHAMSFYSLILEHGVPFQPVNIRVSASPLSLIRKLLSQNRGSYTKLDDLISIGQNLVISMPATIMDEEVLPPLDASVVERKKAAAERRVTGMAIEAALEEDDFETAYSYVVNRLSPSTPSQTPSTFSQRFVFDADDAEHDDDAEDVAWRAALRAGRYNASQHTSSSWSQASSAARPGLRQLEQRMELLSQALLLAPPSHLEDVLQVWQHCEAEMTALLAKEVEIEERFNDAADQKLPGTFINEIVAVQPRREVGRGAAEESPMGLFDVARGAAAALSKSAFPLSVSARAASKPESRESAGSNRVSMDLSDSGGMSGHDERVRKRDLVANVATGALATGSGALASGLGWMLGE